MERNSHPQSHRENPPSYSNRQHKVSLKDSHPCRQASPHSELMSYQQLRKANHTEVKSRVERLDVRHHPHAQPLAISAKKTSRR